MALIVSSETSRPLLHEVLQQGCATLQSTFMLIGCESRLAELACLCLLPGISAYVFWVSRFLRMVCLQSWFQ